jgi:nucleoside-diphosphate-sugar epimerase
MPKPELSGRLVLVTGGAGFIGSHLVDALLGVGARVRVLDNFATGRAENIIPVRGRIELVEGDIRDVDTCRRATRDTELVFHQAALGSVPRSMKDPATTFAVNVQGTVNVFQAARESGARRVIYASSSSVYGDSPRLPKREGEEGAPLSPYALSKLAGEQAAAVFARCFGFETIGLRYFNVFGPRQDPSGTYAAVIPRFFQSLLDDRQPTIYGDGLQSRDFTYVEDAVRANLLAAGAASTACGAAYNVAGGVRTTVLELAQLVGRTVGRAADPVYEPSRQGDVRDSLADLSRSRGHLGFEPAVPLREGLRRSVDYYRGSAVTKVS